MIRSRRDRRGSLQLAVRATGVIALCLPVSGVLLVATAPIAAAAVTNPGDGTVFGTESNVTLRADYPASGSDNKLTLTSPGGSGVLVDSAPANRFGGGELSYALDTGCWVFPSKDCRGRQPAPNGTWTLAQSGGATDRITFRLRIAPRAPGSVDATAESSRAVRVSWQQGEEPDLTGFTIFEGGDVVKDGLGLSVCSDAGSCSFTVSADVGEHTYRVRASRLLAPGSSDTIESPLSAGSSVTIAPPPPPSPQPSPNPEPGQSPAPSAGGPSAPPGSDGSSGPSTGPGSGGSSPAPRTSAAPGSSAAPGGGGGGGGGSNAPIGVGQGSPGAGAGVTEAAVAQREAFALSFSSFGPKLGIPKLPPLPQAQSPSIAVQLPDGTFEETLGFAPQTFVERVPTSQGPARRVTTVIENALDSERLARSTAGALVLLMVGAHLRRWLGTARPD